MAGRETLFNAVKQLQEERKTRNAEMMRFMGGLSDTGKIGYAIGTGLSRLFGGVSEYEQREEDEARAKNAYAETYMNTPAEYRPTVFKEGMRLFPDYAMQVREYQDDQDAAVAEAARTARLMEIKEEELALKKVEAGQIDTAPLNKVQQDYYKKIVPDVAEEIGITDTTWNPLTWVEGLSTSDKEIIIENAEMLRRSNKATNMTPRQALKLAMQNYIGGGNVKQEANAQSQAQAQNKLDLLNKAQD
jgi:hypothetical protein